MQLLGFKFQQLAGEKEGTPHALYLVASHMVKVGWWPSVSASYFSHTASETIVCRDTTAVPETMKDSMHAVELKTALKECLFVS